MDDAEYKHLFPIAVAVEKGRKYKWCGCGNSKNPPFCDKEDCGDKAMTYTADLNEELYFCNCKHTRTPPLCDGSHSKLLLEIIKKRRPK